MATSRRNGHALGFMQGSIACKPHQVVEWADSTVIPAAPTCYDPGEGFAFPGLDYPDVSANSGVMAVLEAAIQRIEGISV
jgi:hypothetical protein